MATASDKTANKVAVCSAIFAGFAYVGYSVVRNAFYWKRGHRRDDETTVVPLYFRRLSQTTQTDLILGSLDTNESGRIILRPLSVQERIRELNLRAMQFGDTLLAIQNSNASSVPTMIARAVPRSVGCTPWGSPRILSPVDGKQMKGSSSVENLVVMYDSPQASPWRRRLSRQPHSRPRSQDSSTGDSTITAKASLDSITDKGRLLTVQEAKSILSLLYSKEDAGLVERALITIANCAAFTSNQDTLREAGCLIRLQHLLSHPDATVRLAAYRAMSNLALNLCNIKELKNAVPVLVGSLLTTTDDDNVILGILIVLTNLLAIPDWQKDCIPAIPSLYNQLTAATPPIRLQTSKLLVNLSTNPEMTPYLLSAKAPPRLLSLINDAEEELLLRLLTFFGNVVHDVKNNQIKATSLPAYNKAPAPETLFAFLYGVTSQSALKNSMQRIQLYSKEDIRDKSQLILSNL